MPRALACALICAILCVILDSMGFRSKGLFATLSALILFSMLGENLSQIFSGILQLSERTGITAAAKTALKAVGLGYIFGITADICDSLGERTIATALTLVGRLQIFLVAYPYFEKIVALGIELIG